MSNTHLEPAATIIRMLGGLSAVAAVLSTTTTTVQRWRLSREKGGTGGFIPHWRHEKIIAAAKERGIAIPPAAFLDPSLLTDAA